MQTTPISYHDLLLQRYPALTGCADAVTQAVEALCACYHAGGKILICGNGGSAADSQHIVGELMKGFILRREIPAGDNEKLCQQGYTDWQDIASHLQRGIPAVALTEQSALSSAVANDLAADMVFAQQVYAIGRPGDVLMGLSTSGNSKNVVKALKVARAFGVKTIGFTGSTPCQMDELCDIVLKAPATETYMVQEYHLPLYHAICAAVEQELFG